MALTNLAVFGGAFFTPILVGKITHTIGWPWSFYFVAIFTGVCLPLVIFLVPETAFRRSAHLNTDMASSDDIRLFQKPTETGHALHGSQGESPLETPAHAAGPTGDLNETQPESHHIAPHYTGASTPKKTSTEMLMPFSGRKSDESFWKLFLRPFPLFAHPAIFWACLIQGTMIGWTVFIGIILAAIFLGPPLFWNEVRTGYAYTGAFIGAVLGFLLAGALADWSAKFMTRKNHGIYEPEFRIILVIPQLVFGVAGLFGFGVTASRLIDYSWVLPVFFFGLQVGAMVIGAVAARFVPSLPKYLEWIADSTRLWNSLYIVDAHRDIAIEAFTCILIFKVSSALFRRSVLLTSRRTSFPLASLGVHIIGLCRTGLIRPLWPFQVFKL